MGAYDFSDKDLHHLKDHADDLNKRVARSVKQRGGSIVDIDDDGISVETGGDDLFHIHQPSSPQDTSDHDYVFSHNDSSNVGDHGYIPNKQGMGSGKGDTVKMTGDEFYEMFLSQIKINPEYLKSSQGEIVEDKRVLRGTTRVGSPDLLKIPTTMFNALGRAIATNEPLLISDADCRYRQYVYEAVPTYSAICVFVLDVSGSIDEASRKSAKSLFFMIDAVLKRNYPGLRRLYIQHTDEAQTCEDQEKFFSDYLYGATAVQSVSDLLLKEHMSELCRAENVFLIHYSDWDTHSNDIDDYRKELVQIKQKVRRLHCGFVADNRPIPDPLRRLMGGLAISNVNSMGVSIDPDHRSLDDYILFTKHFFEA